MENVDLTAAEFGETYKNTPGAILLDVRTEEEFEGGHLPGALNINIMGHEFHEQIEELDRETEYFIYCRSGARSSNACKYMKTQGFEKVHNMLGGILAWQGEVE